MVIVFTNINFKDDNVLKVLSYNVNGLINPQKLSKIRDYFFYRKTSRIGFPHIYSFQESHSMPDTERWFKRSLPGQTVFSHGSSHSHGVLLGIHPASSLSLSKYVSDEEGRYIVAEVVLQKDKITVVSLYLDPHLSPDSMSSILTSIVQVMDVFDNNRILWMGDFNVTLNSAMDSTPHCHKSTYYNHKREILSEFMKVHELTDVWRAMHPTDIHYTSHSTHATLTHTDFMLACPAMLTAILNSDIEDSYCLDHNPVTANVIIQSLPKGKGYWKFPDFLLKDKLFEEGLKAKIAETVHIDSEADPSLL